MRRRLRRPIGTRSAPGVLLDCGQCGCLGTRGGRTALTFPSIKAVRGGNVESASGVDDDASVKAVTVPAVSSEEGGRVVVRLRDQEAIVVPKTPTSAGDTRIDSGSFAPTTVVVITAKADIHVRTRIDFSPSPSSGFHRTAVGSATRGPLVRGSPTGATTRRETRADAR